MNEKRKPWIRVQSERAGEERGLYGVQLGCGKTGESKVEKWRADGNFTRILEIPLSNYIYSPTLGLPNSLYWVLGRDVLPGCWSYTTSRSDLGVYFLPLSPLCFVFFFLSKMPRLELTFSESKFAACQSGTLSRVSRAFRIPDIDSRAKCVRSIKLSLIPNPNTPRKACFKRRLKSCCRSLKAWLTSHFWWILPHFTCFWWILSQATFWMDLRGRRLIYINS